jgi:hypothetical protein
MKCIGCIWGTRINEKVLFCMIPGDGCWKNSEITLRRKKTNRKPKREAVAVCVQ